MFKTISALVAGMLFIATSYAAEDWDREMYQVTASKGDFSVNYRDFSGVENKHWQVNYKLTKDLNVSYRDAENKGKTEKRTFAEYHLFKVGNITIAPRVEYRDIEGEKAFVRAMPRIKYKQKLSDGVAIKVNISPRFVFGKEGKADGTWEDIQTDAGVAFKLGKSLTVEPGIRYVVEGDRNDLGTKKNLFATVRVGIKF